MNLGIFTFLLSAFAASATSSDNAVSFKDASAYPEFNFPKVELHLHFGGAIRPETAFYWAQRRNIDLGCNNVEELEKKMTGKVKSQSEFITLYDRIVASVAGDKEALKQVAYEIVETKAKEGAVYIEVRFSPHLYSTKNIDQRTWEQALGDIPPEEGAEPYEVDPEREHMSMNIPKDNPITPDEAIIAITEGLAAGERDFGCKARSLLCCIRPHPVWSYEVVQFAKKYRHLGIVGIDLAAVEREGSTVYWGHVKAYQEAERAGIYRTVHAAECGSAENLRQALQVLKANRIGHGYNVVTDEALYKLCLDRQVHFEVCPQVCRRIASRAVENRHIEFTVKRFFEDGANFGLNTDDPTFHKTNLFSVYQQAIDQGLTVTDLKRLNLNAAAASFLPDDEKAQLIRELKEAYGMI
ncbi:adenosine deaminase [Babesia ovata]|uniref:adenosine deaminase n=1 Tax=Babesia ovata TaxID=189622 RepID=A0A2H6KKJ8_9APIC|nr:adenosine deaminase [Babesia ovata]GBE63498.1 adenosine deaminase [Babesia ovata]